MARIARVVAPGFPHHVTQRGNRRQRTFFRDSDYRAYLSLLTRFCSHYGVEVWCYCLMPNHVHLIATPSTPLALAVAIGRTHESYTRMINARFGWKGFLWQGRFCSFPMDDEHLVACARYVLLNPVKAGLTASVLDWRWSSAVAHVANRPDGLTTLGPLSSRIQNWDQFLSEPSECLSETLARHGRTGRPLGSMSFVRELERRTGRRLVPRKSGRKRREGK